MALTKSVKIKTVKPTPLEIMMHQALNFGKVFGIEPEVTHTYIRRVPVKNKMIDDGKSICSMDGTTSI